MAQDQFKRKLTAILSADMAGYSRLMQDDETAAVATLEALSLTFSILFIQQKPNSLSNKWFLSKEVT